MDYLIYILISFVLCYPLSHIFMKKGMELDWEHSESRYKDLRTFFYIPFVNVIVTFSYLVWNVIKFKRPE